MPAFGCRWYIQTASRLASRISREHCQVVRRDGYAWLEDRSTYGTFVNESPVRGAVALRVGDRVRLGNPGITLELIQVVDDDGTPTQL